MPMTFITHTSIDVGVVIINFTVHSINKLAVHCKFMGDENQFYNDLLLLLSSCA